MANTAYFTFVDALLNLIRGLPECAPPCLVVDGTLAANWPNLFVSVGGFSDEPTNTGIVNWATLGARRQEENFSTELVIWSWVGGSDNLGQSGTSDAQYQARTNVATIFYAISNAIRITTNVNFSSYNNGEQLVQWCNVSKMTMQQTPNHLMGDDGVLGRSCMLRVTVTARAYVESD
jgi:hypothetical protein